MDDLQPSLKKAHFVVNPSEQDQRDIKAAIHLDCKSCNGTVSINRYCQTLQKLHTKTENECDGKLAVCIILRSSGPTKCHAVGDTQTSCTYHCKIFKSFDC